MVDARYIVICVADITDNGWEIVPACRRLFTAEKAAEYAQTIPPGRAPRIVTAKEYLLCRGWKEG